jgi:Amt family ammonium transporter
MAAIVIGAAAGAVCFGGVLLKNRFGYDDALDAFGVHGVGGALGALLTGVFAQKLFNPAGADGLASGNAKLLGIQLVGVLVAVGYAVVVSYIILRVVDATVGLRVTPDEEREGLDIVLHGESASEETTSAHLEYSADEPAPATEAAPALVYQTRS